MRSRRVRSRRVRSRRGLCPRAWPRRRPRPRTRYPCRGSSRLVRAPAPPPPDTPCQVVTFWENHVTFAPDPARAGVNAPVLLGKLYLFGPEIGFPLTGDGSLVVQLEDETAGKPVPLERWNFDPETLRRC